MNRLSLRREREREEPNLPWDNDIVVEDLRNPVAFFTEIEIEPVGKLVGYAWQLTNFTFIVRRIGDLQDCLSQILENFFRHELLVGISDVLGQIRSHRPLGRLVGEHRLACLDHIVRHDVVIVVVEQLLQLREDEVSAQWRLNDGLLQDHAFVYGHRGGVRGATVENQCRCLALGERREDGVLRQIKGGYLEFLEHDLAELLTFEPLVDRRLGHDDGMVRRALIFVAQAVERVRHDLFEEVPIVDHAVFEKGLHVEIRTWHAKGVQVEEVLLSGRGNRLRVVHVHGILGRCRVHRVTDAHVTGIVVLGRFFAGVASTDRMRTDVDHERSDLVAA